MIIPAIDLMGGQCVRLLHGDFDQRTDYDITPQGVARLCAEAGAEWLHVVDLDGAKKGNTQQTDLIIEIAQTEGIKVQTGGGLREIAQIQRLLQGGLERVVIGSLAVTNKQMVKFWLGDIGPEKIIIALDVKTGENGEYYPTTSGWVESSAQTLWEVLDGYMSTNLKTILVTDISRDGSMEGSNTNLYQEIMKRYPDLDLITSGGVGTLQDVKDLKALNPNGIIIGKALFEDRFTLKEAIEC